MLANHDKRDILPTMTELLPLNTSPLPVKLRVEDYLLLDGSETFDGRFTELIGGRIFFRPQRFRPEAMLAGDLAFSIIEALKQIGSHLEVSLLGSIDFSPHDAPAPDIAVSNDLRGEGIVPGPSVALIVEVAGETLETDLGVKQSVYSGNGVPEYWVVDVGARVIHQMWAPESAAYSRRRDVTLGKRIEALTVEGLAFETEAQG
jgi:Uma2 family endonuclease